MRRDRRGGLRTAVAIVAAALVVLLAVLAFAQVRSFLQGFDDLVTGRTIDRSGPALLQSVRDLSKYDAASGTFQVIVDLQTEATFLPATILGQRTLFVAIGTVDAFVDFSRLGDDAITVSSDQKAVQVRLPHAALDRPNLDPQHSYVFADQRGIVDQVRAFFDSSPTDQSRLYQLAQKKIADAAAGSGLAARAETNTRAMLEGMLRTLGYRQVTVTFG